MNTRTLGSRRLALLLALCPCMSLFAQPLTDTALVEQVLNANPSLQAQYSQAVAAGHQANTAGRLPDPQFSYAIAPLADGHLLSTRHNIQLSQRIPWPSKLALQQDIALTQAQIAATSSQQHRLMLIARARKQWAEWWWLDQAIALNRKTAATLERLLPALEASYAAGSGLQADLLRAQSSLDTVSLQAMRLRQQRARLRASINALRGEPADVPLAAAVNLPDWQPLPDFEQLRQQMFDAEPSLQALRLQVTVAADEQALAKKAFYPDLQPTLAYMGTLDPQGKRVQMGLALNLPLDRSRRRAAVDAAQARQQGLLLSKQAAEQSLQAELAAALAHANEATEASVLYRRALLPKARQTIAASRSDYEAGRGDLSDWVQAELALLDMQLALTRTRADWRIALAEIDRLSGAQLWSQTMPTADDANMISEAQQ